MPNSLKFTLGDPLDSGRPLSTLARYSSWQIRSRLERKVIVDWIEGTVIVAHNGMKHATGKIYCGLSEYADMSFVLLLLRSGALSGGVGANIGSYTLKGASNRLFVRTGLEGFIAERLQFPRRFYWRGNEL
jgi:hypothetical protein